jgi:hypothetical protein
MSGTITLDSIDYEIDGGAIKFEMEKIEYTPINDDGWARQYAGGKRKITGNIKGAVDVSMLGSGTWPAPMVDPSTAVTVPFVFTIGNATLNTTTKTISGDCVVYDLDFKLADKGLLEFTANFESSGVCTFA